jgi:hypothetical protein
MTTPAGTNEQTGVGQITVTASGVSREYAEFSQLTSGTLFFDVSAASGTTPSLVLTLQMQNPTTEKWHDVSSFAAQTAATSGVIAPLSVTFQTFKYRLSWAVTGTTPSFTFSAVMVAYAEEPVA